MAQMVRKLVRKMSRESGYIPNLHSLDLRPGTILARERGRYWVVGTLWERAKRAGDEELAEALRIATERVTPNADAAEATGGHKLGLKYKAGGTTVVSNAEGFKMTVSEVEVSANIKLSFERRKDYLFDTTQPAPVFTFADAEMDDVIRGGLRHLDGGEYVVTSVVWAKRWLFYISRKARSVVGIAVRGAADLENISVDELADLSASVGLDVVADSDACLSGEGESSVAAFTALRRRRRKIGGVREAAPMHMSAPGGLLVEGRSVGAVTIEERLDPPDEDELVELVDLGDDEDDD